MHYFIVVIAVLFFSCGSLPKKERKKVEFIRVDRGDVASELFLKASDSLLRGDYPQGIIFLEQLIKLFPSNTYLRTKYAVALIYDKKFVLAQKSLATLFKELKKKSVPETGDEDVERVGSLLAGLHTVLGEQRKAQRVYRFILQLNPHHKEACIFLAKNYYAQGKSALAHKGLKDCQGNDREKNALFSFYRAQLFVLEKKYLLAHSFLNKSLAMNPNFKQAAILQGTLLIKQKKYRQAVKFYRHYLEKVPSSKVILSKLVHLMLAMGEEKKVMEYAQRLSYLDSDNLNLKLRLAMIYVKEKRYLDAIGSFKEILLANPQLDKVRYYLAYLCWIEKNTSCSIEHFSKVSSSSPFFNKSSLYLAQILRDRATASGKKELEEKFINFVSGRGENFSPLREEMAVFLAQYHEEKMAVDQAIKVLNEVSLKKEEHRYYLAILYQKNNQEDSANKIIHQLLTENPNNALALNHIGYSMLEKGDDLPLAYSYIQRAVAIMPKNGYIRDSLGWYYYKVGKFHQALREVKKAKALTERDWVITKHLAEIYVALKKYQLAQKYYYEALKLCELKGERKKIMMALTRVNHLQVKRKRLPASKSLSSMP